MNPHFLEELLLILAVATAGGDQFGMGSTTVRTVQDLTIYSGVPPLVRSGDFYFVPPGTIHSIGGGLSLLEFQQNADITYRLYDYGRPRELHVDDAIAVANLALYPPSLAQHLDGEERTLVACPSFELVHTRSDTLQDRQRWVIPLDGTIRSTGENAAPGEVLLLEPSESLASDGARMLIGAMPQVSPDAS